MARVTIRAVVYIAADAGMPRVGCGGRVAVGALEDGIVVRIRMARGANAVRSSVR